jgi:hypothetical protein
MELFPYSHTTDQWFAKLHYKRSWKRSLSCVKKKILLDGAVSFSCPVVMGPAGETSQAYVSPTPYIFGKK